ncbi:MAG: response regulator [Sphingobacteriaceae bacterium]|nr:response regulator [Sphingobacteriaceae bacterium]
MNNEKIKILYIDDEHQNLASFYSYFRKMYEVHTALNGYDALKLLETKHIEILIADQRMPGMTGIEFFEKTKILYPDSMRLLITSYIDIEIVIDAINQGQISKYLHKPWDWDKLSLAIENCVNIYNSKNEIKLLNSQLSKSNEELNKFVYCVSHDLRSPLTSILGLAQVAKLKPECNGALPIIEMIEGRIHHLDDFIKNILD